MASKQAKPSFTINTETPSITVHFQHADKIDQEQETFAAILKRLETLEKDNAAQNAEIAELKKELQQSRVTTESVRNEAKNSSQKLQKLHDTRILNIERQLALNTGENAATAPKLLPAPEGPAALSATTTSQLTWADMFGSGTPEENAATTSSAPTSTSGAPQSMAFSAAVNAGTPTGGPKLFGALPLATPNSPAPTPASMTNKIFVETIQSTRVPSSSPAPRPVTRSSSPFGNGPPSSVFGQILKREADKTTTTNAAKIPRVDSSAAQTTPAATEAGTTTGKWAVKPFSSHSSSRASPVAPARNPFTGPPL